MPAAMELAIEAPESPRRGGHSKRLSARRTEAHASCNKQKIRALSASDPFFKSSFTNFLLEKIVIFEILSRGY